MKFNKMNLAIVKIDFNLARSLSYEQWLKAQSGLAVIGGGFPDDAKDPDLSFLMGGPLFKASKSEDDMATYRIKHDKNTDSFTLELEQ